MLVTLEHIHKSYFGADVLKDISVKIEDRDRIGLIGCNGAGKSTLLHILCKIVRPDAGKMSLQNGKTIGFLAQNSGLDNNCTIWEEMQSAFSDLLSLQKKMQRLELEISQQEKQNNLTSLHALTEEYAQLQSIFEQQDGYQIDVKIKTILNGMGFRENWSEKIISTLSGGEKTRLALAKLLLEKPSLLILDEPTNHLDFKTLTWLEDYLADYAGALLVVSHDRYFLDKTVQTIWELSHCNLHSYSGGYTRYLSLKENFHKQQQKEYEKQQRQIAHMQDYINRNSARASTAKSARSRKTALEKMEVIQNPVVFTRKPHIRFDFETDTGKEVLQIENLHLYVQEREKTRTLAQFSLLLFRGEKLGVIGANGVGKSTFLKAVQGLIPYEGTICWGKNVRIGYYSQDMSHLKQDNNVLEEFHRRFPGMTEQSVRSSLGAVLLTGENVLKQVSQLSGGEKARLCLAILMQQRPNVLLMDEPTNHLDMETKEVLEQALLDYKGTIIIVSHDRYLLNRIPDRIMDMQADSVQFIQGKYNDYLAQENEKDNAKNKKSTIEKAVKKEYRTKKDRSLIAVKRQKIRELETQIEATEQAIAKLEEEMQQEEFALDYQKMQENCIKLEELQKKQEHDMEVWVTLSKHFENTTES